MKYEFSLILTATDISDDEAEKLFESGCDDVSILSRGDTTMVQFDRMAATLDEALISAIRDVENAGLTVARVQIERHEVPQTA